MHNLKISKYPLKMKFLSIFKMKSKNCYKGKEESCATGWGGEIRPELSSQVTAQDRAASWEGSLAWLPVTLCSHAHECRVLIETLGPSLALETGAVGLRGHQEPL